MVVARLEGGRFDPRQRHSIFQTDALAFVEGLVEEKMNSCGA